MEETNVPKYLDVSCGLNNENAVIVTKNADGTTCVESLKNKIKSKAFYDKENRLTRLDEVFCERTDIRTRKTFYRPDGTRERQVLDAEYQSGGKTIYFDEKGVLSRSEQMSFDGDTFITYWPNGKQREVVSNSYSYDGDSLSYPSSSIGKRELYNANGVKVYEEKKEDGLVVSKRTWNDDGVEMTPPAVVSKQNAGISELNQKQNG